MKHFSLVSSLILSAVLVGVGCHVEVTSGDPNAPSAQPTTPPAPVTAPPPATTPAPTPTPTPTPAATPAAAPVVADANGKIPIPGNIVFQTGKDVLLPESYPVLDQVKTYLDQNPTVTQMRIEGHTDNQGDPKMNLKLSGARAEAVVAYLTGKGVAPTRLIAVGFGDTKPLVPNTSPDNMAQNRRVEFHIATSRGVALRGQRPDGGAPLNCALTPASCKL